MGMRKESLLPKIAILLLFLLGQPCMAKKSDHKAQFLQWKKSFISKSIKKGLPQKFLEKHLMAVSYDQGVIDKDRNQITSNTSIDYEQWIQKWMKSKPSRIEQGKKLLSLHKDLLDKIEKKYQVDKEVIVSLWGVETLYGKITGNHSIIKSLTSLAFDKRRRKFFERELFAALKIIHEGHIKADQFLGSWAGALGQCQFMPTSFIQYAQDFDGDGKKDIWNNHADIFASIANYLKKARWKKGKIIGQMVKKTAGKNFTYNQVRSPAQYNKLGIRLLNGNKLKGEWKRRAVALPHKNSPLLLRGSNYRTIMRWNRSSLFAALNIILIDAFQAP